jgi:hypothetical protein
MGGGTGKLDQESIDYFKLREQVERAAAETAGSEAARRAHIELADGYAALVRQAEETSA